MSQYFDIIIHIINKGYYKENINLIKETTNYYGKKSKYSKIWSGLQIQKLSLNEITKDSLSAVNGNSDGVILFQSDLNNIVNFNDKSFIRKTGSFYNKYFDYDGEEPEFPEEPQPDDKPVIYLYPEKPMNISIKLKFKKTKFKTIYPKFNSGKIYGMFMLNQMEIL